MFCRDLLAHVRGLPAMHAALPPWRISGEHIEATLRNQRLRSEIFETFRITLDLDKRYELVALIMAVDRGDRRKMGEVATSMTEQKLREAAFYWWREGFSETNAREDFGGVLEELEGLGILTHDRAAGNYQLSSPIIANLIGSEADVYDRLIAFAQEPAPHEIEPSKRRARLSSMSEPRHKRCLAQSVDTNSDQQSDTRDRAGVCTSASDSLFRIARYASRSGQERPRTEEIR